MTIHRYRGSGQPLDGANAPHANCKQAFSNPRDGWQRLFPNLLGRASVEFLTSVFTERLARAVYNAYYSS